MIFVVAAFALFAVLACLGALGVFLYSQFAGPAPVEPVASTAPHSSMDAARLAIAFYNQVEDEQAAERLRDGAGRIKLGLIAQGVQMASQEGAGVAPASTATRKRAARKATKSTTATSPRTKAGSKS